MLWGSKKIAKWRTDHTRILPLEHKITEYKQLCTLLSLIQKYY